MLLLVASAAAHIPFDRGTTTITEVHAGPAAEGGQWFEVRNDSANTQNLVEQVFTDADGDSFQVGLTVLVHAGAYAVFASADSTVAASYHFPAAFDLRPDAGAVVHTDLHGLVDAVAWDASWGIDGGSAVQADGGIEANEWANDLASNWCALPESPGAANARCPGTGTDDDGDGWTELAGDCDDTDPGVFPGAADGADPAANDADCDGIRDDHPGEDTGDTAADTGDTGGADSGGDSGTDTSADTSDTSGPGDTSDTSDTSDRSEDGDTAEGPGAAGGACSGCGGGGGAGGGGATALWIGIGLARVRRRSRD